MISALKISPGKRLSFPLVVARCTISTTGNDWIPYLELGSPWIRPNIWFLFVNSNFCPMASFRFRLTADTFAGG
jgi:hypothetical protein